MNTTIRDWRRRAASIGMVLAGLLAAPLALAHDTTLPQPEGGSAYVSVSAGRSHSCGVKMDGSVDCWGDNSYGQAADQAGPYLSVSAGQIHTCGLKTDGSVHCWGNNTFGQAADQTGPYVAVSTGLSHTCGLKTDGSVHCWGSNYIGEAGDHSDGPYVAVAVGEAHSCALKADGALACWGSSSGGKTTPPSGTFVSVTSGYNHSCALRSDGTAACWGDNSFYNRTVAPPGTFLAISSGDVHNCGIRPDASVQCWGGGGVGGTGVYEYGQSITPAGTFVSIAAGGSQTCAVKADGSMQCWGDNTSGQTLVPASLGAVGFGQIAAGNAHACDLKRDGTITCWGNNDEGQATAPSGQFTQVVAGDSHSCAIGTDSKVTCWGRNGATNTTQLAYGTWLQLAPGPNGAICALPLNRMPVFCKRGGTDGSTTSYIARQITHNLNWVSASNAPVSCFVKANGGGFCAVSSFDAAHSSDFAGPWQRLESGLNHQCGLKANGTIACWGDNTEGQTTKVPSGQFRALSTGYNHACAIKGDGTLSCWGSNLNGQATPPSGTFVQVAAGNTFTCAIRDTGGRVCWGAGAGVAAALVPGTLPNGLVGAAYSQQFSLSGDAANLPANPVYGVSGGNLPDGLSLSANGLLNGTPTMPGTFTFSIDAEGTGGFAATQSYSIVIADGSPPQITYTLTSLSPGSNGWYTGDVTITWSVVDPDSAVTIDAGCGSGFVDTLNSDTAPAGVTFSCSAHSAGGSAGPVSVTLKRDAANPAMSIAASAPANGNGWYAADVSLLASCSDPTPGSGVASCPSLPNITSEGTTTILAQPIHDIAGNVGTSNTLTVKIDKTAPTITAAATSAPNGSNGWYTSSVGVAFTCNDALSGVASCPGNQTLSTDGNAVSSTAQTIQDNAGNSSAVSNVVTVKIDQTAPTLAPTVPSPILRGQSYSASPNAADALSGLASASCGALDTTTTGSKSTSCTATDKAGNSNTVTLNYTVTTTCANDGYKGAQLTWCQNICENGLTGQVLDTWIHRWIQRYRDLPYCQVAPQPQLLK